MSHYMTFVIGGVVVGLWLRRLADIYFSPKRNPKYQWEGVLEDDCILRVGGWLAHAERMGGGLKVIGDAELWEEESWFLAVYYQGEEVFHSISPEGRITTGEMARTIAEAIISAGVRYRV